MTINAIIKYYKSLLMASRTNEPVTYYFIMRQAESIYSSLTKDDLELIEVLIKESGIDPIKKDAIALHIIDTLQKENNMTTIFETKEEHIAFRTKWKEIHNELRSKKETLYTSSHYRNGKLETFEVQQSALSMHFHLIYLSAMGKLDKGMSTLYNQTRRNARHGDYTAAFEFFGDTLTPEYKNLILQQIHEFVGKY